MFILSYQIVSDYWVIPNYDILVYFQTYLTLFCGLKKICFTLFCFANPHDFSHCFTYVVFLVLSRWLWNTFIWKKMWKVPLIVQGPTINWFQWKLTTKLEFWRWNQRFLFSMLLAYHKKSYLICAEFSKYYVIFILIFFNLQNWDSQQGRDSCLKINKYYVIFRK